MDEIKKTLIFDTFDSTSYLFRYITKIGSFEISKLFEKISSFQKFFVFVNRKFRNLNNLYSITYEYIHNHINLFLLNQ